MLRKMISGGQTGADRAGLDFAIETGLEHGGYQPAVGPAAGAQRARGAGKQERREWERRDFESRLDRDLLERAGLDWIGRGDDLGRPEYPGCLAIPSPCASCATLSR